MMGVNDFVFYRNEDWWYAKHTDPSYQNSKSEGYVPRNYVAIEDTLESQEYVCSILLPFATFVLCAKTFFDRKEISFK